MTIPSHATQPSIIYKFGQGFILALILLSSLLLSSCLATKKLQKDVSNSPEVTTAFNINFTNSNLASAEATNNIVESAKAKVVGFNDGNAVPGYKSPEQVLKNLYYPVNDFTNTLSVTDKQALNKTISDIYDTYDAITTML